MLGQFFDRMQRLRATGAVFGDKHGGALHHAHQSAGARDDVDPVRVTNGAQRLHRIAYAQVVGSLVQRLLGAGGGQIRQCNGQPFQIGRAIVHRLAIKSFAPVTWVTSVISALQSQRHLRQKNATDTALVQQCQ